MSNKIIAWIKEHPYKSAGIVVGVGTLYLLLKGSNSTAGASQDTGVDSAAYLNAESQAVQAGTQLQAAQIQANQAALISNNQAAVANNQITGQEVIAQLQSTDTLAGISATRDVQLNADTLSAETTQAVSLLQAQVAENQIAAQTAQDQINATAYTTIATAPYQSADYIANLNLANNAVIESAEANFSNLIATQTTANFSTNGPQVQAAAQVLAGLGKAPQRVPGTDNYTFSGNTPTLLGAGG